MGTALGCHVWIPFDTHRCSVGNLDGGAKYLEEGISVYSFIGQSKDCNVPHRLNPNKLVNSGRTVIVETQQGSRDNGKGTKGLSPITSQSNAQRIPQNASMPIPENTFVLKSCLYG